MTRGAEHERWDSALVVRPEDARNFRIDMVLVWPRWNQLEWWRLRWRRMTRWWRPRDVVAAVDRELGWITLATERWSWRRWRWERVE